MFVSRLLARCSLISVLFVIPHPAIAYQVFKPAYAFFFLLSSFSAQYLRVHGQFISPSTRINVPDPQRSVYKQSKDGYLKVYADHSVSNAVTNINALAALCVKEQISEALEKASRYIHAIHPKNGCFYPIAEPQEVEFCKLKYESASAGSDFICYEVRISEADILISNWNKFSDKYNSGSSSSKKVLNMVVNEEKWSKLHAGRVHEQKPDPGQVGCTDFFYDDYDQKYGQLSSSQTSD